MWMKVKGVLLFSAIVYVFWMFLMVGYYSLKPTYFQLSPSGRYLAQFHQKPNFMFQNYSDEGIIQIHDLSTKKIMVFPAPFGQLLWPKGSQPFLAIPSYPDNKLIIYSTKDGSIKTFTFPKYRWNWWREYQWSPSGQTLLVSDRDFGHFAYWREGMGAPKLLDLTLPLGKLGWRNWDLCWLSEEKVLLGTTSCDKKSSHFYEVDLADHPILKDITDLFPPMEEVFEIDNSPAIADVILIEGGSEWQPTLILFSLTKKEVLKQWDLHYNYYFRDNVTSIFRNHSLYLKFAPERSSASYRFLRVSLPDLKETQLFNPTKDYRYLIVHPEEKWIARNLSMTLGHFASAFSVTFPRSGERVLVC